MGTGGHDTLLRSTVKRFSQQKKPDSEEYTIQYDFIYRKFRFRQKSPVVFRVKRCLLLCRREATIIGSILICVLAFSL